MSPWPGPLTWGALAAFRYGVRPRGHDITHGENGEGVSQALTLRLA
jgi:hypothetical protein